MYEDERKNEIEHVLKRGKEILEYSVAAKPSVRKNGNHLSG